MSKGIMLRGPAEKKTRHPIPGIYIDIKLIDTLLKQQIVASDKKFILQRLSCICDLWPIVFYKVLDQGGELDIHTEQFDKNMAHDIAKPWSNLMSIDQ